MSLAGAGVETAYPSPKMAIGRGKALFVATCLGTVLGCGARTDTLFDDGFGAGGYGNVGNDGTGGSSGGYGTGGYTAGSFGTGGYTAGSFGTGGGYVGGYNAGGLAGFYSGGSVGFAGSSFGGFGAVGGFFGTGGLGTGGFGAVAGSGAASGSFGTGGVGTGGFGAVGGISMAGAGGSGGIVDLCVGVAQTACNKCLCTSCGSDLNACFSDLGCALIFACVGQTKCEGFGCYQSSTCRGVIDQFGGLTGSAVAEVFSLATCSLTTRSTCGCN